MCNEQKHITAISDLLWTPVRTKPRQEKKLAKYCKYHSVRYYLPLRKSVKRFQRRTVEFEVPMFSGYVFCALDDDLYRKLLESGAILHRFTMDERTTEKRLINDLNALLDFEALSQQEDVIVRPEIVSGVKVVVRSGALQGVLGIVERRGESSFLSINVDILGQSVSTRIDIEDVNLVD